jgi:hypothetical protein
VLLGQHPRITFGILTFSNSTHCQLQPPAHDERGLPTAWSGCSTAACVAYEFTMKMQKLSVSITNHSKQQDVFDFFENHGFRTKTIETLNL